jgi:hypothetical protein
MKVFVRSVLMMLCLIALTGPGYADETQAAPAPTTLIKKAKLQDLDAWMQLPEEKRILIVEHWLHLHETTRPAFPLYRTLILQKQAQSDKDKIFGSAFAK